MGLRNLVANFLRYRRRLYQRVVRDPADIAVRLINRRLPGPLAETRDYSFDRQKQRSAVLGILQELGTA